MPGGIFGFGLPNTPNSLGPNGVMDPGAQPLQALMDGSGRQDIDWSNLQKSGGNAGAGGFGMNMGTLGLGISGLGALGNIWSAFNANKLGRDQLDFAKATTNTNLTNQIKSYNTALNDRITARGVTQGMSSDDVNAYIARNQLSR